MVDKIVGILQGLQKDVGELRTDVHKLSDKVDNLVNNQNIEQLVEQISDVVGINKIQKIITDYENNNTIRVRCFIDFNSIYKKS
jgi:uncharacterized protein YoxC